MSAPVSSKKISIRAGRIAFANERQALAFLGLDAHCDTNCDENARTASANASKLAINKNVNESKSGSAKNVSAEGLLSEESRAAKDANNNLKNAQRNASAVAENAGSETQCKSPCKKLRRLQFGLVEEMGGAALSKK